MNCCCRFTKKNRGKNCPSLFQSKLSRLGIVTTPGHVTTGAMEMEPAWHLKLTRWVVDGFLGIEDKGGTSKVSIGDI